MESKGGLMGKFVCDLCGKSVTSSQALGSHRQYKHGQQKAKSLRVLESQTDTGDAELSEGSGALELPQSLKADKDILSLRKQIVMVKLEHELSSLREQQRVERAIEQTKGSLTKGMVIDDDTIAYNGKLYNLSDARDRARLKLFLTTPAVLASFGIDVQSFTSHPEDPQSVTIVFCPFYLLFYNAEGRLLRVYDATVFLRFYTPQEWELIEEGWRTGRGPLVRQGIECDYIRH